MNSFLTGSILKSSWVQVLVDYLLGAIYREVASGMLIRLVVLVELMFFCGPSRWPFLLASDFGIYYENKSTVIPGQVLKRYF